MRRLPVRQKAGLAAEVVRTYRVARRALADDDLQTVLTKMRRPLDAVPRNELELDDALRLGRAVSRTLTALPADSRCLMQSIVLIAMLARRGVSGTLVIGVKPGSDFGAHAWVELDGSALLPRFEHRFARLAEL